MTISEIIREYIACRDWCEADDKITQERQKPVRERMGLLEARASELLNQEGGESIKTEHGTVYRATVMQARVADRELFMDFVFDGRREGFLTSAVAKEAVKEHLDMHHGQLPAGVDVTYIHKTNFRRS